MSGFQSGTRAVACVLSCTVLAGCSTTGIRHIDQLRNGEQVSRGDWPGEPSVTIPGCMNPIKNASPPPPIKLSDARECVQRIARSLSETELGFYDQAYGWNYAFTAVAGGVVGTTIFGAAPDAIKALALGGGSLAALNSIQPPGTLAGAYGGGATALQCVVNTSNQIPADDDWREDYKRITKYKTDGDGHLDTAIAALANNPDDSEIATLKTAIDGYNKAQQLYTSVIAFLSSPPALLLAQIDVVRMRIVPKLAPNPTTSAGQETAINNYITAMQSSAGGTTAKSEAHSLAGAIEGKQAGYLTIRAQYKQWAQAILLARKGVLGAKEQKLLEDTAPPPASNLLGHARTLNADTQNILSVGQTYSDIQAQIAGCIARMP